MARRARAGRSGGGSSRGRRGGSSSSGGSRGGGRGGISVTLPDLERLRAQLGATAEQMETAGREALAEAAKEVQKETRDAVRKDKGALAREVRISSRAGGTRRRVGWFGSRGVDYARYQEFGTSSVPARPALVPAAERERSRLPQRVADAVRRAIQ
ncbi:HK97-gp10 family putative phage morphogenesis protein [Streptomyces bohaiensis]|uniref:HK97-gp10 family putative phage morphogenesis protein n=1 Tax=Streptomyces bohaiensis TaxID=1431344 RepID=UPI003B760DDB